MCTPGTWLLHFWFGVGEVCSPLCLSTIYGSIVLGTAIFHGFIVYFGIRRFLLKFLIGVVIYICGNVPFIIRERELSGELQLMVVASLMVGLIICLFHLMLFRKSPHNTELGLRWRVLYEVVRARADCSLRTTIHTFRSRSLRVFYGACKQKDSDMSY